MTTSQISDGSHDACKEGDNTWKLSDNYISFGKDGSNARRTYLKFQLSVPNSAIITSAKLQFKSYNDQSGAFSDGIEVYDTDNMGSLSTEPTISRYGSINYSPASWTTGNWYDSSDISVLVQHIVNRTGWEEGNYIGFYIGTGDSGNDERRTFYAYEGGSSNAAKLIVNFTVKNEDYVNTFISDQISYTLPSSIILSPVIRSDEVEQIQMVSKTKMTNNNPSHFESTDFIIQLKTDNPDYYTNLYDNNIPVILELVEWDNYTCEITSMKTERNPYWYDIILNLRKTEGD